MHGAEAAERAEAAAALLFGRDPAALSEAALATLVDEIPTSRRDPVGGSLVDLVADSDLATSKSDARRALEAGELWCNNEKVDRGPTLGPGRPPLRAASFCFGGARSAIICCSAPRPETAGEGGERNPAARLTLSRGSR